MTCFDPYKNERKFTKIIQFETDEKVEEYVLKHKDKFIHSPEDIGYSFTTYFMMACHFSKPKTAELFWHNDHHAKTKQGLNSLWYASNSVWGNTEEICLKLLDEGVDHLICDENGSTVLMKAAGSGYYRLIKRLISMGMNPLEENETRKTALHFAVIWKSLRCTKYLLKYGGDFNKIDSHTSHLSLLALVRKNADDTSIFSSMRAKWLQIFVVMLKHEKGFFRECTSHPLPKHWRKFVHDTKLYDQLLHIENKHKRNEIKLLSDSSSSSSKLLFTT